MTPLQHKKQTVLTMRNDLIAWGILTADEFNALAKDSPTDMDVFPEVFLAEIRIKLYDLILAANAKHKAEALAAANAEVNSEPTGAEDISA